MMRLFGFPMSSWGRMQPQRDTWLNHPLVIDTRLYLYA
jgi:hypothetical protein